MSKTGTVKTFLKYRRYREGNPSFLRKFCSAKRNKISGKHGIRPIEGEIIGPAGDENLSSGRLARWPQTSGGRICKEIRAAAATTSGT
jgi:hypothetical protein